MERVRHPTPKAVLHHDTLLFRVFRAFRGWIPACLVGETATDERDAHTPSTAAPQTSEACPQLECPLQAQFFQNTSQISLVLQYCLRLDRSTSRMENRG